MLKKRDPNAPISANGSARLPAEIKIWDAKTGALRRTMTAREATVSALVFSPDSKSLAIASVPLALDLKGEKAVVLVDAASGEVVQKFPTDAMWVGGIAFSPDGASLAAACSQRPYLLEMNVPGTDGDRPASSLESLQAGQLRVWETATGKVRQTIACGPVTAVQYSPDGMRLVAAGRDLFKEVSTIAYWDLATGTRVRSIEDPNLLAAMAQSSDGQLVAASGALPPAPGIDGIVTLYNATTGDRVGELASRPDGPAN